jgi:hypothetical protein
MGSLLAILANIRLLHTNTLTYAPSASLTKRPIKLACLSLASLSNVVYYLIVKLGEVLHSGRLLTLQTNIRLGYKAGQRRMLLLIGPLCQRRRKKVCYNIDCRFLRETNTMLRKLYHKWRVTILVFQLIGMFL